MRFRSIGLLVVGGLVVAGGVVAGVHYSGGAPPSASSSPVDELAALGISEPSGSAVTPNAAPPPAPVGLNDELLLVKPLISDTPGPLDRGTATLAIWASKNLTWSILRGLPATSAALFRKDPDEERGHLLCIEGEIEEIRAEKNIARRLTVDKAAPLVESASANPSRPLERADAGDAGSALPSSAAAVDESEWAVPAGKVYFATIVEQSKSKNDELRGRSKAFTVEALAVRSTGTLVDGDSARFCGILTGVVSPSGGGDGRLIHRAVGLFELPENTGAAAAQRAVIAPSANAAVPAAAVQP